MMIYNVFVYKHFSHALDLFNFRFFFSETEMILFSVEKQRQRGKKWNPFIGIQEMQNEKILFYIVRQYINLDVVVL